MLPEAKQAVGLSFHPAPIPESSSNFLHLTHNLEIFTHFRIIDTVAGIAQTVLSAGKEAENLRQSLDIPRIITHPKKAQVCLLHDGSLVTDFYDYLNEGGVRFRVVNITLDYCNGPNRIPQKLTVHKPGSWNEKRRGHYSLAANFDLNSPLLLNDLNRFIYTPPNGNGRYIDPRSFRDDCGIYFSPSGYNPTIEAGSDVLILLKEFKVPKTQRYL
jgi:hypothetical protein